MWLSEEGIAIAPNRTLRKLGVETKTERNQILPESTVHFNNNDGDNFASAYPIEVGETCTVIWDGVSYSCVCKEADVEGESFRYLGDASVFGLESTGEPFIVLVFSDGTNVAINVISVADENNHTCSITKVTETITPIDPKYLPGVCLPMVELTTVGTSDGVALTAEESAKMEEVAALGLPIIVKAMVGGAIPASGVYSYANMGYPVFTAASSGMTFTILKTEGVWVFVQT